MIATAYIRQYRIAELKKKKKITPNMQGKPRFKSKSINTQHMPEGPQACFFFSAAPPPLVNANYF